MKSSRTTQVFVVWVTVTERGLFGCCSHPCGVSNSVPPLPTAPPPTPMTPPLPGRQIQRQNQLKTAAAAATFPCGCCSCLDLMNEMVPCFGSTSDYIWALGHGRQHQKTTQLPMRVTSSSPHRPTTATSALQWCKSQQKSGWNCAAPRHDLEETARFCSQQRKPKGVRIKVQPPLPPPANHH